MNKPLNPQTLDCSHSPVERPLAGVGTPAGSDLNDSARRPAGHNEGDGGRRPYASLPTIPNRLRNPLFDCQNLKRAAAAVLAEADRINEEWRALSPEEKARRLRRLNKQMNELDFDIAREAEQQGISISEALS